MSIRSDLYNYKRNKRKIRDLNDRILYLRTKAAKVTPSYASDECRGSGDGNRVEDCIIKIIEIEKMIRITQSHVNNADQFLESLKPYHRYIVWLNMINHVPRDQIAKQEKTTAQNIKKIMDRALNKAKAPE